MNDRRFEQHHVDAWREDGFALIPDFFALGEIEPLRADFANLYGAYGDIDGVGQMMNVKAPGDIGKTNYKQFQHIDKLPYDGSAALNLISMHPALIEFAKALLDTPQVHCYQSHTWAKFTGEADFDQAFHCDFGNHTLLVPADEVRMRTVDFIFYITDVTDDLGALHYVTKTDAAKVLDPAEVMIPPERQQALKAMERSAAGPSGTLVAHSIDTVHRGTNLTRPNGHRYTMTVGYKAAGNDMIGFHVWQTGPDRPWNNVMDHASPEQLEVLGIPLPGDAYWTPRTLQLTQRRWPEWDMQAYFDAAR
ncbi:MAG: phytanoyl-CoA dioxygenase family protein [Pseudomonadota bacterium]